MKGMCRVYSLLLEGVRVLWVCEGIMVVCGCEGGSRVALLVKTETCLTQTPKKGARKQ